MRLLPTNKIHETLIREYLEKPIMVHTSVDFRTNNNHRANEIEKWHTQGNGWSRCGYPYVIEYDGTLYERDENSDIQIHCNKLNQNRMSLGVCLVGDGTRQYATTEQCETLDKLISAYGSYGIYFHCDFDPSKECPGSFVIATLQNLGRYNILRPAK